MDELIVCCGLPALCIDRNKSHMNEEERNLVIGQHQIHIHAPSHHHTQRHGIGQNKSKDDVLLAAVAQPKQLARKRGRALIFRNVRALP